MGTIIPFVTVDDAASAIAFYKDVFNAEVQGEITMLQSVPGMDLPEYAGKIGHCNLRIYDSVIFINDAIEQHPLQPGDRIQLVLDLPDEETLKRVFKLLSLEGTVVQPLETVFWGGLFGTVKDKFGVNWQIYARSNKTAE